MLPSRALSSADEGGPALKKLRATTRGVEKASNKSVAAADDARSKKARARPALTLVNLFSSAGRRPQPTAVSSRHVPVAGGRSDRDGNTPGLGTRRSARLMGNGNNKPPIPSKVDVPPFYRPARVEGRLLWLIRLSSASSGPR